jgi:biotin carboxyl carrier protein
VKLRALRGGVEQDVAKPPEKLPRGVRAVRDGKIAWVFRAGETYRIEQVVARGGAADVAHDLEAPMPGKVVRVLVEVGQEVAKGTPLLVLEAMKMEHEIRAPRDGRVKRIASAGQMVALGEPLVDIE